MPDSCFRVRDRESCLKAGMDAYVAKPISLANLVTTIESVVSGRPLPGGTPS